jgi:glycogen phosphorylase/synthase
MTNQNIMLPDALFEVSWEVCNKVGGIHTVISTKAIALKEKVKKKHIFIGPDVWRDTKENPEFREDENLLPAWKNKAMEEGLSIRIGHWNIPGNPMVITVDFSSFISQKDEIFARFWEEYKLDSLSGQWDYIEPMLFGYAAARVIESYSRFNLSPNDSIIAQFHEWMTGSGVLYLKEAMPQIGTIFTTHATVLGRCLAGNGMPLYDKLPEYNGDIISRELGVVAKYSLEKISGEQADVFTTVSDITANECKFLLNKEVDLVTPNGFENSFVPKSGEFEKKAEEARRLLIKVACALTSTEISKDALLLGTSGRYEFTNKGYDLFIDALGNLNKNKNLEKEILAFILVPANNYGPRKQLVNKLADCSNNDHIEGNVLTHNLHDADYDPILNRIKNNGLFNSATDKVKVIFVPSYLNGDDGIFDLKYWDLLIGLDLTVFASYYEPWGYTPLESIAFGVPTITTTLAGFGKWMQKELGEHSEAVYVINRTDTNANEVVTAIAEKILICSKKPSSDKIKINELAKTAGSYALWVNLVDYYTKAYNLALQKVSKRKSRFAPMPILTNEEKYVPANTNTPNWRKIEVLTSLPECFSGLNEIARNLWWCWSFNAMDLFKLIDIDLWREKKYNPIAFLEDLPAIRLKELETDDIFVSKYNEVYSEYLAYMKGKEKKKAPKIGYFSMEYGMHDNVKIFSGGLGILAGDYLKEASDQNVDMIGVGLLYRYGYFKQTLTVNGEQQTTLIPQDFTKMPLEPLRDKDGNILIVNVKFPGRNVYVKAWKLLVGRIDLLLLDTDHDLNQEADRKITHQLYGGGNETRFMQEMILGIGGIRVLSALDIRPDIYHCNEGHAAFIGLERLRLLRTKRNLKFNEALEIIRASTLFTTHTPVPAGHDLFEEDLMRIYMAHYPERLKITWEEMMSLGKLHPGDKFSMSNLAVHVSQEVNGVSWLHGEVSKKMFTDLWPGYFPEESPIGYVTNGVHFDTWTAKAWKLLYLKEFGEGFKQNLSDTNYWNKIYNVPDETIWDIRLFQRFKLIEYVRNRVRRNWIRRYENPKNIVEVINNIDENALTIGFARRFATYKRAHLLFRNIERLSAILNNPNKPVQIIFAGKAHPNDKMGQDLIKYIVEISKRPGFLGKIVFLENYDIELARKMVQGVDIWMNTPTRPLEASGTSGMKAVMNGALHFSVLDGWWVEGYMKEAGWALAEERTYENQDFQDELDAETIYAMLENEIVPLYYKRNEKGIPTEWVKFVKNSIANIAPKFTTKRMMDDYYERFYNKLYKRSLAMKKNDYQMAIEIAAWKESMKEKWNQMEIVSVEIPDYERQPIKLTEKYRGEIKIDLKDIKPEEIGVELVVADKITNGKVRLFSKYSAELSKLEGNIASYIVERTPVKPGSFNYSVRIFAKNNLLPYQQDFPLVKWV